MKKVKTTYRIESGDNWLDVTVNYNDKTYKLSIDHYGAIVEGELKDVKEQGIALTLAVEALAFVEKELTPRPKLQMQQPEPHKVYGKIKKPAVAEELLKYLKANRIEVSRKSGGVGVPTCVGDIPPALLRSDNKLYKAAYNRIYYKKQLA